MRFSRRWTTIGGKYFDRFTLVHDDIYIVFAAWMAVSELRASFDLTALEQTLKWQGNTYTFRKIDDCTWEVL